MTKHSNIWALGGHSHSSHHIDGVPSLHPGLCYMHLNKREGIQTFSAPEFPLSSHQPLSWVCRLVRELIFQIKNILSISSALMWMLTSQLYKWQLNDAKGSAISKAPSKNNSIGSWVITDMISLVLPTSHDTTPTTIILIRCRVNKWWWETNSSVFCYSFLHSLIIPDM